MLFLFFFTFLLAQSQSNHYSFILDDGSGFIQSIVQPNQNTVWSTGDLVKIQWICNNTSPSVYPEKGVQIQLYRQQFGFDQKMADFNVLFKAYRLGLNEVSVQIPRFSIKNASDRFYLKFFKNQLFDHVYAQSVLFTIHSVEQGEWKENALKKNKIHFIDYLISPKNGDHFEKGSQMEISFATQDPIPPNKKILICLALKRKMWFDKDCLEKILLKGPYSGTVKVKWIVPDYLKTSDQYYFRFYNEKLFSSDLFFKSATFSLVDAQQKPPFVMPVMPPQNTTADNSTALTTNSTVTV